MKQTCCRAAVSAPQKQDAKGLRKAAAAAQREQRRQAGGRAGVGIRHSLSTVDEHQTALGSRAMRRSTSESGCATGSILSISAGMERGLGSAVVGTLPDVTRAAASGPSATTRGAAEDLLPGAVAFAAAAPLAATLDSANMTASAAITTGRGGCVPPPTTIASGGSDGSRVPKGSCCEKERSSLRHEGQQNLPLRARPSLPVFHWRRGNEKVAHRIPPGISLVSLLSGTSDHATGLQVLLRTRPAPLL